MKKRFIASTTINPPTKAVKLYDTMPGWHLVMAGDKKTPPDYRLENGTYLTPADQEKMDPEFSEAVGWNCLQRRNFAILWAFQQGAEVVAVVDDDNIPLPGWGENVAVEREIEVTMFETSQDAFDPLFVTNYPKLWHRGFPLQMLSGREAVNKGKVKITPDVQADLWNGDPDIDAICRMEHKPDVTFTAQNLPFTANKPMPFNSQNTFLGSRCIKDYFLFPKIGRMDDIWAAYWLQAKGYTTIFQTASVVQERNPHDLTVDFRAEILGYTESYRLLPQLREDPQAIFEFLPEGSRRVYDLYRRHFN